MTSHAPRAFASTTARTLVATAVLLAGASGLAACASDTGAPGATYFPNDAPAATPDASFRGCLRTADCLLLNHICAFRDGTGTGNCEAPPDEGRCAPDLSPAGVDAPGCYPGARCQPVPTTRSALGGLCSFGSPQAPLFTSPTVLPKISLTAPNLLSELGPTDGVQLRWTPPALPADAVVVATVFDHPPQRDGSANRIANPADLLWIWSSTDPGASTTPGVVALSAGHRGAPNGAALGPAFGTNQLAAGRYWWFVYALRGGVVAAASDVVSFRVGNVFPTVACGSVDACTAAIAGELPDTVACVEGQCRQRCASDLDCPGAGTRCQLGTAVLPIDQERTQRHGAFCTLPTR